MPKISDIAKGVEQAEKAAKKSGSIFSASPADYAKAAGVKGAKVPQNEEQAEKLRGSFVKSLSAVYEQDESKGARKGYRELVDKFDATSANFMDNPRWQNEALAKENADIAKSNEPKKPGFFANLWKSFLNIFGIGDKKEAAAVSTSDVKIDIPNNESPSPEKEKGRDRSGAGVDAELAKAIGEVVSALKPATPAAPDGQAAKPKKGVRWADDVVESDVVTKSSTTKKDAEGRPITMSEQDAKAVAASKGAESLAVGRANPGVAYSNSVPIKIGGQEAANIRAGRLAKEVQSYEAPSSEAPAAMSTSVAAKMAAAQKRGSEDRGGGGR